MEMILSCTNINKYYKHVGATPVVSHTKHTESVNRLGSKKGKCKRIRRKILKSPNISLKRKLMIVNSLKRNTLSL